MSLFKAREWWETRVGVGEEFDQGCMCLANVDNAPDGNQKIVVGSFQGMLRIYYPKSKTFKAEDLVLETNLELPILQVEAGLFVPDQAVIALAVLHPRKLSVYLVGAAGQSADATYFSLFKQYEHVLERNAHSFTYGPFGGVYGRDYICVQSMDGLLMFFEQHQAAFTRALPNFLLPGPVAYVPKIDSILVYTSRMALDCYKYQVLAAAMRSELPVAGAAASGPGVGPAGGGSGGAAGSAPPGAAKRVPTDWSLVLGELVWHVFPARASRALGALQQDIVCVGTQHIFCVSETGTIRQQKRLHYVPSAVCPYVGTPAAGAEPVRHNLLVASHTGSLAVYKEMALAWSATLAAPALVVRVGRFGGIAGLICTLSEDGALALNFLGTDPATTGVVAADARDLDYEAMNVEHRQLQRIVRDTMTGNLEPQDTLQVRCQPPLSVDDAIDDEGQTRSSCLARLMLSLPGAAAAGDEGAESTTLTLRVPPPFAAQDESVLIGSVPRGARTPLTLAVPVRLDHPALLPSSLAVHASIAYTVGATHQPRCVSTEFALPFAMACRVVAPVKTATFKLTFESNRDPPPLSALFEDLFLMSPGAGEAARSVAASAMSVRYPCGDTATVLVSKQGGRYRLQADTFEAMALLAAELERRLSAFYLSHPGVSKDPFQLTFAEAVPLLDFFAVIEAHFQARVALQQTLVELENRSAQFRAVQKRLLTRFKEKTPTPLGSLPALLEITQTEALSLAARAAEQQSALKAAAARVAAAASLIVMLLRCRFNLDDKDTAVLRQSLSVQRVDDTWEEETDAAMMQLLRTVLAKSTREQANMPQPLAMPADTQRLRKHVALVVERIGKGMKLTREKKGKGEAGGAGAAAAVGGGSADGAGPAEGPV